MPACNWSIAQLSFFTGTWFTCDLYVKQSQREPSWRTAFASVIPADTDKNNNLSATATKVSFSLHRLCACTCVYVRVRACGCVYVRVGACTCLSLVLTHAGWFLLLGGIGRFEKFTLMLSHLLFLRRAGSVGIHRVNIKYRTSYWCYCTGLATKTAYS